MPATISAILFDKDGTLIDYHRTWSTINRDAAKFAAGKEIDLVDQLLVAGGWDKTSGKVLAGSLLAAGTTTEIAQRWQQCGSRLDLNELTHGIDRIFTTGMATAVPVGCLRRQFADLKSCGFALGIASSDNVASVAALIERFELTDYVDFASGYDSGFGVKPGPGMLLAFCGAVGSQPDATAVVGDNLHDMHMADRGGAGLKIAVLTGTGTRAELVPASDFCIASIEELDDALASRETLRNRGS